MEICPEDIRAAVELSPFDDTAARELMGARPRPVKPPRPWREGAVLVLLYDGAKGLDLVLTRRTDRVEHHRSQLSLPGGAREDGEELLTTALRESEEEIGVPPAAVEVLGELPPFKIPPSSFIVTPFVGYARSRPEFRPDPVEVAEVHEIPFRLLLDESRCVEKEERIHGVPARVPYYDIPRLGSPPLWGATAMMLSGLVERVRALNGA